MKAFASVLVLVVVTAVPAGAQVMGTVGLHVDYFWPGVGLEFSKDYGDTWSLKVYSAELITHVNFDSATGKGVDLVQDQPTAPGHSSGPRAVQMATFCLEVGEPLPTTGAGVQWNPYEVTTLSASGLSGQQVDDINKLWENYNHYLYEGTDRDRNLYTGLFQSCIWEIVEETSGAYGLNSGSFQIRPLLGGPEYTSREMEFDYDRGFFDAMGNSWLTSLADLPSVDASLAMLKSDTFQNLLVKQRVGSQVPEPLTMSGVALALISVGAYLRKRKIAQN